ncbi:hypothetical protein Ep4_013 [Pseudomonas phage Ep4]|uniref:Uncharacterized protein n=1 Tax=Pseudomonas phage Ep4 TaxID=3057492 RepID=A0AAU9ELI8_9CAUD|nr:hypothetical protein Ep4_013 [Pseudomonas phage Ep4]
MSTAEKGRHGAGRTMATLLATQIAAYSAPPGYVVVYAARQLTRSGMVGAWMDSMDAAVSASIQLLSCSSITEVVELTRDTRVHAVYVDHSLLEQAEENLETRIEALRKEHAAAVHNLMSIR